jgi:SAM-dependent methyltransferase
VVERNLGMALKQEQLCSVCNTAMVSDLVPATFHCPACGFFGSQLPVRINAVQRIDEDTRERALKGIRLLNFQQLLTECADLLPSGARLLDIGCAHGWFMEAAKARGITCVGIEPDLEMERRATSAGHKVIAGLFPDAMPDGARFDAITFNDVFEHLPDANGIAHILPDYLEPGGTVIVNLPVADGLIFRMARLAARFGVRGPLNRMWQAGLPSPHLSYFTGITLQRLFEAAGFSCVQQGQLRSLSSNGLYDRIRYDRDIGFVKAAALYTIARAAGAVSRVFTSDIQYFVFRLRA